MNDRDFAILETVNRLRLITSRQLERLCFSDLTSTGSRSAARGRTLRRLISWERPDSTAPADRRVWARRNSTRPGSRQGRPTAAGYPAGRAGLTRQVRFPGLPGVRTVQHTLDVLDEAYRLYKTGGRACQRRVPGKRATKRGAPLW